MLAILEHQQQLFSCLVAGASQVKWNRRNQHLLASSHDGDVRIWDRRVSDTLDFYTLNSYSQCVYVISFPLETQHGSRVCSGTSFQDPRSGLAPGQRVHPGHVQPGQLCQGKKSWAFSDCSVSYSTLRPQKRNNSHYFYVSHVPSFGITDNQGSASTSYPAKCRCGRQDTQ